MKTIRKIAEPFKHVEIREVDENESPINHYVIAPGDDCSNEPQDIQDVCAELHTTEIIALYQNHLTDQMD